VGSIWYLLTTNARRPKTLIWPNVPILIRQTVQSDGYQNEKVAIPSLPPPKPQVPDPKAVDSKFPASARPHSPCEVHITSCRVRFVRSNIGSKPSRACPGDCIPRTRKASTSVEQSRTRSERTPRRRRLTLAVHHRACRYRRLAPDHKSPRSSRPVAHRAIYKASFDRSNRNGA
jgi:hypothetical protein